MAIVHTTVATFADEAGKEVNKAEWNAAHTIENDTVTYAMMQNVVANNRILGRISGAAGDIEELTNVQVKTILAIVKADISDFAHTHVKADITDFAHTHLAADLPATIVYNNQANVFGDFNQTFKDNRILIESPDGLTPTTLINSQQTLARNLTIPILTGNRNIIVTGEVNQIGDIEINTHTTTKITTTSKSLLNSDIVYTDQANIMGDFDFTVKDNRLRIESPDGLTPITIINSQQTLARNLTVPILTGNRNFLVSGEAQIVSADIGNDQVTYAKIQNISVASRFLGRITAGAGDTEELTGTQATTLLDVFTSALKGLAPSSGGGTTNFLRADGSWTAPTASAISTWKNSVRAATTANITLSGTQTVDGVALVAGNECLVKNQTTGSENGIYIVSAGAWTRRSDFDAGADLISNSVVMVQEGTANLDKAFQCTTNEPITIGSTTLVFAEFGAGGGGTHNLLSATHGDTLTGTVVRGDIIVGNSTPAWARLVKGADATVLQSDSTDALWRTSLKLAEITAPASPAANQVEIYNFNDGGIGHVRTIDEYGLIDIFGKRDVQRTRRQIYFGVGSDTSAGTDSIHWGFAVGTNEGTYSNINAANSGYAKNFATGTALDNDAGFFTAAFCELSTNPDITIKFRSPASVSRRIWIGFMEADHMGLDTDATNHKFALRISTSAANVNICLVHSNGTTETITQLLAVDTAVHTFRIIGDNANSRFGYSLDGAAITWVTTNIPTSALDLILQVQVRNLLATTARNLEVHWLEGTMDV